MSEIVDRVAEAALRTLFIVPPGANWAEYADETSIGLSGFRKAARAAIKAMRTPTKDMLECCHDAGWHGVIEGFHDAEEQLGANLFRAMIDRALK